MKWISLISILTLMMACSPTEQEQTSSPLLVFPSVHQGDEGTSELRIFEDSTFLFKKQHEMGFMIVNYGNLTSAQPEGYGFQKCLEVEDAFALKADSTSSETLTLKIDTQAGAHTFTAPFKAYLFDTLVYTFENNTLELDKKQIFGSIEWPVSYEQFDEQLLGHMVLKSGPYAVVFFESSSLKEVTLLAPTTEALAAYGKAQSTAILKEDGEQLKLLSMGEEANTIATFSAQN
ncbi:MAG: hypothetical protein AAFQ98_11555 [Bacteroidota bacterium]